jgi:pimeloyl-ACP methyl ester carboxylesterase
MQLLKETKEEMPGLKLHILERSAHWGIIEKPGEMCDILMEFLSEIRNGSK